MKYPSDSYILDPLPERIIDMQWQDMFGNWQRVDGYYVDPYDSALRLRSYVLVGRPLRIVYVVRPTRFTIETDDYSVTGLPDTADDVLVLGTLARMTPGVDVSRAQLTSVEQSDRNKVVPNGAGVTAAKYLMAEYQMRLQQEATALRGRYRQRTVKVGN